MDPKKKPRAMLWSTMLQVYSNGAYRNVAFIDSYEVTGGESPVIDLYNLPNLLRRPKRPTVKIEFIYPPQFAGPLNAVIGKQCCLRLLLADYRDNESGTRLKMHSKQTAEIAITLRGLLTEDTTFEQTMGKPWRMKIEIADAKIEVSDKPAKPLRVLTNNLEATADQGR